VESNLCFPPSLIIKQLSTHGPLDSQLQNCRRDPDQSPLPMSDPHNGDVSAKEEILLTDKPFFSLLQFLTMEIGVGPTRWPPPSFHIDRFIEEIFPLSPLFYLSQKLELHL